MSEHRFPYRWFLKDGYPKSHGFTVFSTFACGGGSTMGYKLAGYKVVGCVEIDRSIYDVYVRNHHPEYAYCEDIRSFRKRDDLPRELFDLDILDGSPPCSSFSLSGKREKYWGRTKRFREGQATQVLDDLFFEYIALAERLQPRVVVAENVKGLILGNAKGYVKEIKREFEAAGYNVQLFLLNAASMGVPQQRERVFFICHRKDLRFPRLNLSFNEPPITYGMIKTDKLGPALTPHDMSLWRKKRPTDTRLSDIHEREDGSRKRFNAAFALDDRPLYTLTATGGSWPIRHDVPCRIHIDEYILAGTFPLDYDFNDMDPKYLIGMSVPPVMMAQIATEIKEQWLAHCITIPA